MKGFLDLKSSLQPFLNSFQIFRILLEVWSLELESEYRLFLSCLVTKASVYTPAEETHLI